VLVLLPPSEGKASPMDGAPVDLDALAFPSLNPIRERLLRKFKGLDRAPAAPAREVYTGVLYQRLGLQDLPGDRVLIASALWGMVRPQDRIPHYKLPIGAKVPRVPSLTMLWKGPLAKALPDDPGLVLDLRSGGYAALWKPPGRLPVRAFTEDGKVVSHATPEDVLELVTAAGMRAVLRDGNLDVTAAPPPPAPPSPSS
jgi:cytoplasmic iron level regulating protein YaaA (DUF328/UPF0246 family)